MTVNGPEKADPICRQLSFPAHSPDPQLLIPLGPFLGKPRCTIIIRDPPPPPPPPVQLRLAPSLSYLALLSPSWSSRGSACPLCSVRPPSRSPDRRRSPQQLPGAATIRIPGVSLRIGAKDSALFFRISVRSCGSNLLGKTKASICV